MFKLNIQNDVLRLQDIKLEHLPKILEWYNNVDDFKYATGVDTPITLEVLTGRYAEVAISSNEFFAGIYVIDTEGMVGLIKGRVKYREESAVWISSLVIAPKYQRRGIGTVSINLLLNHLKKYNNVMTAYLSVVEENIKGKKFWDKLKFQEVKKIDNYYHILDKHQNVSIMYKLI